MRWAGAGIRSWSADSGSVVQNTVWEDVFGFGHLSFVPVGRREVAIFAQETGLEGLETGFWRQKRGFGRYQLTFSFNKGVLSLNKDVLSWHQLTSLFN